MALLFYVGAISTAAGFLLFLSILRHLPAGTASLNMFAIPVIALASSAVIFDERLSQDEWLGISAIAIGLLVITWQALRGGCEDLLRSAPPGEGG